MTRAELQGSNPDGDALLTRPEPVAEGTSGQAAHSRLVQRLRRRYELELPLLAPGAPTRDTIA